jgi:hypothetical protein
MLAGSAVASVTRLKVEVNDALLESLIRSAGTPSRATPSNRPQRLLAASRSAGSCEERHRTQLATRARRIQWRNEPRLRLHKKSLADLPRLPRCGDEQPRLTTCRLSTRVAYVSDVEIPPVGQVADRLAAVGALRRLADQLEDAAVEEAMRAGWSWPDVAGALGVTRQAVYKKHARRLIAGGVALRRRSG